MSDDAEYSGEWKIEAAKIGAGLFGVTVSGSGGSFSYQVKASTKDLENFGVSDVPVIEVISEAFQFLLEREGPSTILSSFELPVIAKYFPEFKTEIGKRFKN